MKRSLGIEGMVIDSMEEDLDFSAGWRPILPI